VRSEAARVSAELARKLGVEPTGSDSDRVRRRRRAETSDANRTDDQRGDQRVVSGPRRSKSQSLGGRRDRGPRHQRRRRADAQAAARAASALAGGYGRARQRSSPRRSRSCSRRSRTSMKKSCSRSCRCSPARHQAVPGFTRSSSPRASKSARRRRSCWDRSRSIEHRPAAAASRSRGNSRVVRRRTCDWFAGDVALDRLCALARQSARGEPFPSSTGAARPYRSGDGRSRDCGRW